MHRPEPTGRRFAVTAAATAIALAGILAPAIGTAPAAAQGAGLTDLERRIAAHADAYAEDAIALLQRTVDINSGTLNARGVRRVADALAPEFEALGFRTRWAPLPDSLDRAGHLIAERTGTRGKRLLLIGHLDTVFEEDSPFQRFVREDTIARGPGVNDMKGGNVVMIQALRALHEAGQLDGTTITVVLTGDEEAPGRPLDVARHELIEAAKQSDVALGFEAGSIDAGVEYAVIARRSSSTWTLTVTGRPAHSSTVFRDNVGAGAIYEASRILNTFYAELRGEQYLTFNPGVMLGGTEVEYDAAKAGGVAFGKTNVVAERVVVRGDIRTITDEQLQRTRERMRHIVARGLPGTRAEIEFSDGYPSMPPTDGNGALLEILDRVSRDLGHGPIRPFDPGGRGAADISFVAPYVDGLDGLGPYGTGSHTVDETVNLRSITAAARRAALLIHRLTREEAAS